MKIIKRKTIKGFDCKITFHKPITLQVIYYKKEKFYIVSHKKAFNWGFGSTIKEAIKEVAECFDYSYWNGLHTRPSKANGLFEKNFNYLREIIKKVEAI